MAIPTDALLATGGAIAKWLAARFFDDTGADVGGGLTDLARNKIPDVIERRNAVRQFDAFADRILQKLRESLEIRCNRLPQLDADRVFHELSQTLGAGVSDHFLRARDVDPLVIDADLKHRQPIRDGFLPEPELRVYGQMLQEVVRYMIEVASLIPKFEESLAVPTLRRLSNLDGDVQLVLQTAQCLEGRVVEPGARSDSRFEADYRAALIRSLDRVDLFGADIPPENQRNLLTEAFVTLNVDCRWDSSDSAHNSAKRAREHVHSVNGVASDGTIGVPETPPPPFETAAGQITCRKLLDSLDATASGVLIRGSAGSGKTTLLRWAAIEAAAGNRDCSIATWDRKSVSLRFSPFGIAAAENLSEAPFQERSFGWLNRVPFFIPLRHCQSGKLPEPDELPMLIAKEVGRPRENWVREVLNDGRAIVLLDGVDEVPEQSRATLRDEIKAIIKAYPLCYFVLSSRPTAVQGEWDDWLKQLNFRCADVSPMSMPEVKRFVEKWHEATAKELARQGKPNAKLAKDGQRLIEQFELNPPLSVLATNPLLCAMICALHRWRFQKLPESQYELCETLCHMLLHNRERESHLNWHALAESYIDLSYEQKRGIAQQLAQWLMRNGQSAMPIEVAYEQVAGALQRIPGRTPDEAPLILKTLVERSGLLREPNPDVVDFLHNTFKELLAGDDVAARNDVTSIVEHLDDESWRRVGLFAVASPRSQTFAGALIAQLLKRCEQSLIARPDARKTSAKKKAKTPARGQQLDPRRLKSACRTDRQLLTLVLFILQCRRVAAFLDPPQLSTQVDRLVNVPYPPVDSESAEAIARLGDAAIEPLIKAKSRTSKQQAATARALRLINSQDARAALRKKFIDSNDWEVIGELASIMNPLEIPAVLAAAQIPPAEGRGIPDTIRPLINDLSPLANLTSLQSLSLSGTGVRDISPLAALTELRSLSLTGTQVSDIRPLASLTRLESLSLSGTAVFDVDALSSLTSLKTLHLDGTDVREIIPLASLKSLDWLDLNGTGVRDIDPISSLSGLKWLDLSGTGVRDVSSLSALTVLERLYLNSTDVTDIKALASLTSLQWLDLNMTQVRDISAAASFACLRRLGLNGTNVSDVGPLGGLTDLNWLDLNGTRVSDVSPLASLTSLHSLDLTDTAVSDTSMLEGIPELHIRGVSMPSAIATRGTGNRTVDSTAPEVAESLDERNAVHLSRLDMGNWRGFERKTFEFANRITVIIGNNAAGKTSTLEALAQGLAAWCGAVEPSARRVITDRDVRHQRKPDSDPPQIVQHWPASVRCSARFGDERLDWFRTRGQEDDGESDGQGSPTSAVPQDAVWAAARRAERDVREGRSVTLPLFAYYPARRIWKDATLVGDETHLPGSRLNGYDNCFEPDVDVRELKRLMKTRTLAALQRGRSSPDLIAIQQAVLKCLMDVEFDQGRHHTRRDEPTSGGNAEQLANGKAEADVSQGASRLVDRDNAASRITSFDFDINLDELVVGFDDGRLLPLGLLSDGQRTTIALLADIARRAATLNPQFGAEAAAKCPGIVLIDEIELHLHPRWQRSIINDLRETFPLMQFVIATHSPLIIQSCRSGEVISLDQQSDFHQRVRDYSEMSPEDILEYVQGVEDSPRSERMLAMRDAAEAYYAALQNADSVADEERERLKRRLEELEEPFTSEPGFYAFLRRKRAVAGLED